MTIDSGDDDDEYNTAHDDENNDAFNLVCSVVKLNAEYNADEYNAAADYDGGNDDDDDDSSNLVCSKAQCQSTSCPSSSVPPHFSEAMIPL